MLSCCQLCGQKYLDMDGKVDNTMLERVFKDLNIPPEEQEKILKRLCMCQCHTEGLLVIH